MTQILDPGQATEWTCATLDDVLRIAAARWPERHALDGPDGRLTFQELNTRVTAAAAALAAAGLERGDRFALVLPGGAAA
ncbi:MAG: amino acid adenylation protein, partial [Dactylosporangium sp.]|nr:amino acid adenylation protein [Dactylosporangium sp.]